ncbi:MAG TPA: ATP-binding cassette domain-containing protein [Acidimicrobiales bacterium]|nr:ATP-binding cassette domain-containing protein [Acidimicrobiales bacterium]
MLRDVELEVQPGEFVALVGSNGAGKTALLRTLAGRLTARGGLVRLDGVDITRWPTWRRARSGIVHVPQERHLFPTLSVEENLRVALLGRPHRTNCGSDSLGGVYAVFPRLAERRAQDARTLSGGEQQMLALARALVTRPGVLLADELATGLAPGVRETAFDALRDAGTSVLLAEQNASTIAQVDRTYDVGDGTVAAPGENISDIPALVAVKRHLRSRS